MATVTSLTEEKIQELMAGWELVGLSQEEINALVIQMRSDQQSADARLTEFNDIILPQLREDLAAGSIRVSELNDTTIPDLQASLAEAQATVNDLAGVDIPALRDDVNSAGQNIKDRPQVFVQADEPPAYDDLEDRYLVVGDTWYDSENVQRIWDGVQWTSLSVDIPDLSATIDQYLSPEHALYKSPVADSVPVTNGANIVVA